MNERNVESIVRRNLEEVGLRYEEQQTSNKIIQEALNSASKSGKGNQGRPEFIVQFPGHPDTVMLIECKASEKKHASENGDNPRDFAVDGVLHYASFLEDFTVIAIAVSGETNPRISTYIVQGTETREIKLDTIKPADYYINEIEKPKEEVNIPEISKEIHNYLRDYAKLSETEKPLIVGGVLIALYDTAFRKNFRLYPTASRLAEETVDAIKKVLISSNMEGRKINSIIQPYSFISVHPELTKGETLRYVLVKLDKCFSHQTGNNNFDMVGEFYKEFLRYTGGDKKGLGIVLTPGHITELFCKLSNLTTNSVVLDPCCGTGGFLIAAMNEMLSKTEDPDIKRRIKQNNLIGIEQSPNMFALAASNMILRGDGKANLRMGSCFDFKSEIILHKPTIGMINPPYSQKGDGLSELDFIECMLDYLEPNGIGIAIVPMSCAISNSRQKIRLLEKHTLEAVMTMPTELFYPVGVNTCIMIFTAKVPHSTSNRPTWFGMWKEDGFIKTKMNGRIPKTNWQGTLDKWVSDYKNQVVIPGYSIKAKVTASDEWCAEAYLETDYSDITTNDFLEVAKSYTIFQLGKNDED